MGSNAVPFTQTDQQYQLLTSHLLVRVYGRHLVHLLCSFQPLKNSVHLLLKYIALESRMQQHTLDITAKNKDFSSHATSTCIYLRENTCSQHLVFLDGRKPLTQCADIAGQGSQ